MSTVPTRSETFLMAAMYVSSGICQPLIMTICKEAGLADPTAQLYMLWYYLGQSVIVFTLLTSPNVEGGSDDESSTSSRPTRAPLTLRKIAKSGVVSFFDIVATAMNYTGATLAGPTIFAVVYSSVTVWTAIFSRIFLKRLMVPLQWFAVFLVFCGLGVTATDSVNLGSAVIKGTALVFVGSCMHALTYVWNEWIMTRGPSPVTVNQNSAIQGLTAMSSMLVWQVVYTLPRWDVLIRQPAYEAGTTLASALAIFFAFALANFIHSITFYFTLRHYPGGAVSAGVMKGLQAVLVFVAADWLYCGRVGGREMCFSTTKLISLVTVVGGVALFGIVTERVHLAATKREDYTRINSQASEEAHVIENP